LAVSVAEASHLLQLLPYYLPKQFNIKNIVALVIDISALIGGCIENKVKNNKNNTINN